MIFSEHRVLPFASVTGALIYSLILSFLLSFFSCLFSLISYLFRASCSSFCLSDWGSYLCNNCTHLLHGTLLDQLGFLIKMDKWNFTRSTWIFDQNGQLEAYFSYIINSCITLLVMLICVEPVCVDTICIDTTQDLFNNSIID